MRLLYLLFFAICSSFAADDEMTVSKSDGVPFFRAFPEGKLWAIGDVHGDVDALRQIYYGLELIDKKDRWIGGPSGVVMIGDLVGKGKRSRETLDFVMKMEEAAKAKGGFVETVIGNHEWFATSGYIGQFNNSDMAAFASFTNGKVLEHTIPTAFGGDSKYAKWLGQKNAIAKVGSVLFAHAGLGPWIEKFSISEINSTVRDWMQSEQGNGKKPEESSRWVVGSSGPTATGLFSSRTPRSDSYQFTKEQVDAWLDKLKAQYLVVGHVPTADASVSLEHPRFGKSVVNIDTGIGASEGGHLSALEIKDLDAAPIALQFARPAPSPCAIFEK